jgi:hypothetical protein
LQIQELNEFYRFLEFLNSVITYSTYSVVKNQAMKLMTSKRYPILIARRQLGLCCVLMLISLAWGCAVAPKTLSVKDRSQSFEAKSFEAGTIISTKTGQPISFEALV